MAVGHEFASPTLNPFEARGRFRPLYAEIAGLSFLDFTLIPGISSMLLDNRVVIAPNRSSLDGSDITVFTNGLDIYWGKSHGERVTVNGSDIVVARGIKLDKKRYINVGDYYRISYVSSTDRLVSLQILSHHSFHHAQVPYRPDDSPKLLRRLSNGHSPQPHTG